MKQRNENKIKVHQEEKFNHQYQIRKKRAKLYLKNQKQLKHQKLMKAMMNLLQDLQQRIIQRITVID